MTSNQTFIDNVAKGAIEGWRIHQILPSISIAQAILESNWGKSELAVQANNLFGIKGSYKGESYVIETWEHINGEDITVEAAFKKYPSKDESVEDHGAFFTSSDWRRNNYQYVIGETDYKRAAQALSDAGYATDPDYPNKLINIVETYDLTHYDEVAIPRVHTTKAMTMEVVKPMANKFLVGLDTGHSKDTFPAEGKGVYQGGKGYAEFDFNMKVTKRIEELLSSSGIDVTRGQPYDEPERSLTSRTNWYNSKKCDLVVSIHANAGVPSARGICAFYWHTDTKGRDAAQKIINNVKSMGYATHGNGLHVSRVGEWTNLHMVRETAMPAVLVEHGFMTNKQDFQLIFGSYQAKYVEDMALANAKAICDYFGVAFKGTLNKAVMPSPVVESVSPAKTDSTYTIVSGDTLAEIAEDFGTTAAHLAKINNLTNPNLIKVGQVLTIREAPKLPTTQFKIGSYATVYERPDFDSKVLENHVVGAKVNAIGWCTGKSIYADNVWATVTHNKYDGYIHRDFLEGAQQDKLTTLPRLNH